ncbi:fasciclin domain-containing protein [Cereibacter sphaeroides]|uniref:fasciclin domain-containing protein n=1 Tax=Cereibacter sphaeroides TaxID=1063 RepID=UPI001FFC49FF|nr:fasciclin domain-containing protein [Cereibacter sphaeroides]
MRKTLLALSLGLLAAPAFAETGDIVETATGAGSFTTLLTAAEAAGLVDTLKGDGPFTVFAPTDAAFAALPEGTVEDLLKPENKEKLTEILTYHVVPGEVMSSDLTEGMTAETVEGNCRGRRFCHPLPRLRPALPVFVSVKRFLGADGPGRKRIFWAP